MPTDEYDPEMRRKFISVTGGVMSGLGEGITAASAGRLLKNAGFDITAVKIDPYLNVDAGAMNPYEHGEVYVLKNGVEADLDLGNYGRLLGIDMTADHNITTDKTYQHVIQKERDGDYLGKAVQIIPHVTEDTKRRICEVARGTDVCIVEVGGTASDIESMPFLESLRQFASEEEGGDVLFIHVTLVPYSKNGKQKTKPTQHSVRELRSIGLQPDVLVGRVDDKLEPATKSKIAQFCDVPNAAVLSNPDVPDTYHVPLMVGKGGLDEYVVERLGIADEALPKAERDNRWRELVTADRTGSVDIALVDRYTLGDAYMSIHEALKHVGIEYGVDVNILWVDSNEMLDKHEERLRDADGVVVPGGLGSRGAGGKIEAIRYARENDVPLLGLCLGFRVTVVGQARNVLGYEDAHSAELDPEMPYPVIDLLPEQYEVDEMGGTIRLGVYDTDIDAGTLAEAVCGDASCTERHRHRYEVNPELTDELESEGLRFSNCAENRMEILELTDHPFFFETQLHPELRSQPDRVNPLFLGFLRAVLGELDTRELGGEEVTA